MMTADDLIAALDLRPLPLEGGYYRETYRSADLLPAGTLPRFTTPKAAGTAINMVTMVVPSEMIVLEIRFGRIEPDPNSTSR